ncbi:hypothetical protein NDU88_001075 [Pleurodeles waltl]|uniref:Uncharacterized protein n=1 Tax=Pleurodeles waltl TaxID=8319 RepID=A0AAV7R7Z2_PLEWA|nr:hypothetical protein NDU88_001075 [Pleurodeles waltl]
MNSSSAVETSCLPENLKEETAAAKPVDNSPAPVELPHPLQEVQKAEVMPCRYPESFSIAGKWEIPQEKSPSLKYHQEKSPSLKYHQEKSPSLKYHQEKSPSLKYHQEKSPSLKYHQEKSPSLKYHQEKSPSLKYHQEKSLL